MGLLRHLLPVLLISQVIAQSCTNYGSINGTSCECPPGVGGSTCSDPACGGNLFQGSTRKTIQATSGSLYGNLTTCQCESGWGGVGCNVCQTSSACESAYTAIFGNGTPQLTSPTGLDAGNKTITCSTQPRVWAAGQMSCGVRNPTLSAVFPGRSTLNILRTLDPTYTLAPNISSFGSSGNLLAMLWYDGEEQFVCQAKNCNQVATNTTTDWSCNSLECQCRPGAAWCGKVPASVPATLNVTNIINALSGTVEVKCSASEGTVSCQFLQETIASAFGNSGLQLNDCIFGECVRQNVIEFLTSGVNNSTSTNTSSDGTHLSDGVIAGLAIVGGLVFLGLLLLLWGFIVQRRARKDTTVVPRTGGVTIEWKNIDYSIPSSSGVFAKSTAGDGKVILHNLSGVVRPGEMLAVLGPSGAGKTSLIDILGGKNKSGHLTGTVTYTNSTGDPIHRPRIGFVDQSDVLPSILTVQEALTFAAQLRMPESVSAEEKEAKVFEVMQQLGLVDIKDTRIGNVERRGISGGEARRVSIGLELVASPDILVLDEPTSGLDSVSAVKVAQILRDLAHHPEHPTACVASVHQPNSKLYTLFDNVLVLSRGRSIYHGAGGLVPAEHFASKGYPPQPGYNVADHLLDIASEPTDDIFADNRTLPVPSLHTGTPKLSGTGSDDGVPSNEKANVPLEDGVVTDKDIPKEERSTLTSRVLQHQKYTSTFLTQFQVLCGREWKILRRDYTLFVAHLAVASILGVFCGGLYYKTGITIAGFQSRVGCLFFLGSLLSFSALSALYNLGEIRPLFLRERAGSYYSPTAWLLSRFFFDVIPLRVIPTIVVSTIVYWMAGLSPNAANFFKFLFILVLFAAAMTLFNFLLACLFRNGGIAILLSALFNLFIMTFAGFFVHLNDIPPVLRWLQWFSTLKYCLEALAVNEVGSGLMIEDELEGVPVNVSAQLIMNLLFGFGADNYYRDVLVLFAFIAGFGVSLIAVVWWAVRERR